MKSDPLLEPFTLKHLTLKNRIMLPSHEPAYAEEGLPKERYIAYQEERARAGVGLTMTAGSAAVSRDSPPVFNNILAYKDEVVPWIKKLTDACHAHGAGVMIQLTHLGRRTHWNKGDWLPAVAPSHQREASHRAFPKKMEEWDRERILKDFVAAAERMKEGGMDGIELQIYGHLLDQIWSPRTNRLEAPYGGSLENRVRFPLEIVGAIRKKLGAEFILGIRYTADEVASGGIVAEEGIKIAQIFRDTGHIDFLNVIRGHIDTDSGLTDVIPVQGMRAAPHLDFAGWVKKTVNMPVFHAARIPDIATARHAVGAGLVDMVGMARAHMADPHIVRKIMERQEENIRPCVGATYCLDRIYQAGDALCIHNAATGRELSMPHIMKKADVQKKIIIAGAGPAGLEAARIAGEKGHQVVILEAAPHAGGQVKLLANSPRRREMMSVIEWRLAQCDRFGVEIRYSRWAESADIKAEKPDVVIVATGGQPDREVLESGNDLVISAWDILSGDVKPGQRVLLFDDAGDHVALQAGEKIADGGGEVEIMTPDRSFCPDVMAMNLVPYMRAMQDKKVIFTVTWRLMAAGREGNQLKAVIGTDYSDYRHEKTFDQIIVNHGTIPLDDLYFALKPDSINLGAVDYDALIEGKKQDVVKNQAGAFQLFRIGDAVSARNIHAGIYDALRLMKDI